MKRFKIVLVIYLLSYGPIFAQDPKVFLDFIKHAFDSIENQEYLWQIERTFEPSQDILKGLESEYKAKMDKLDSKDPQTLHKIAELETELKNRKKLFGSSRKRKIDLAISYLNSRHWHAQQIFHSGEDRLINDYYYNQPGLACIVSETNRSVQIVDDHKTDMLGSLVSGQPLFILGSFIDAIKTINIVRENPPDYELKIQMGEQSYLIANLNKRTFVPTFLCYYVGQNKFFEMKALNFDSQSSLPNSVTYIAFSSDGKEVFYTDKWTLVSSKLITNPSAVQTDYKLKRGYSVTMQTGGRTIKLRSDEMIEKTQ